MSGRRSKHTVGGHSSSFSFLDTLICTMGVLLVLLHAYARHGQVQVSKVVAQKSLEVAAEAKAEAESLAWDIEQLQASRAKTEAQLVDERLKLSHVEDHQRRLVEKFEKLKIAAAEFRKTGSARTQHEEQKATDLEATKLRISGARRGVDDARKSKQEAETYSVVPYEGPSGTRRRPIYIECRADSIVLQPEGVVLDPEDFAGFNGPGNPLASALRSIREYWNRQSPGAKQTEPYPLLLVRPEGIAAYYEARSALDSWGADFGYELIGSDWTLKFPEPDPHLAQLANQVVAGARLRQRDYLATTSQLARNRSRPGLRASARGGFVAERGSGGGRGGGESDWQTLGSDWARRKNGSGSNAAGGTDPTGSLSDNGRGSGNGFASGGNGAVDLNRSGYGRGDGPGGTASGSLPGAATGGVDRYGQPLDGSTGIPGGVPDGSLAMAGTAGGDGSGNGGGSQTSGGLRGGGAAQQGSAQGGTSSEPGGNGGNSSTGSASPSAGNGGSTPRGADSQNGGAENGTSSANSANAQNGGAARNAGRSQSGANSAGGGNSPGGSASQGPSASQGGSGSASGSNSSGSAGSSSGATSGTSGSSGGSSGTQSSPNSPSMPSLDYSNQPKKTNSMAKTRGRDWGLPDAGLGHAPATRPIRIQCHNDRLVIMSESKNALPKEVRLTERAQDSMDEFVAGVWQHMKGWGTAGKGLYWRPTLLVEVEPGAADRYAEVKGLLENSGLDVHERQPQPTATLPAKKKTRK